MVIPRGNNLFAEFNIISTLRNRDSHQRIELPVLNNIARDILGHLEVLHGLGYVHSNIKPQNIIMSKGSEKSYSLCSLCNAIKYMDELGEHKPQTNTKEPQGSLLFKS